MYALILIFSAIESRDHSMPVGWLNLNGFPLEKNKPIRQAMPNEYTHFWIILLLLTTGSLLSLSLALWIFVQCVYYMHARQSVNCAWTKLCNYQRARLCQGKQMAFFCCLPQIFLWLPHLTLSSSSLSCVSKRKYGTVRCKNYTIHNRNYTATIEPNNIFILNQKNEGKKRRRK